MPILLYCICDAVARATEPLTGVARLKVIRSEHNKLSAFISSAPDPAVWLRRPLRESAIEFHRVRDEIFNSAAIIPFRFPTTFETEEQLAEHISERSAHYKSLLEKFGEVVQMELRIYRENIEQPAASGAEYLKHRQDSIRAGEHFSAELRQKLSLIAKDWRERPSKEGVRLFALVARSGVAKFEDAIRAVFVPENIKLRVSGPWPVSEFIEQG
jgi:hypothetical protein